jgi:hypothetical protein
MKTIVLVGCGKTKLDHPAPAKDLYIGPLFKKARAYAERVGDEWAILSAKHFLVLPDEVIAPYERKLESLHGDYLRQWIWNTNWFIRCRWETWKNKVRFICLAGKEYAQAFNSPIIGKKGQVIEAEFPLEGMGIGERLKYLSPVEGPCAQADSRPGESVLGRAGTTPQGQATFWRET